MIRLLLISALLIWGCQPGLKSQKIVKNNSEFLFGEISKKQLYFDYPLWEKIDNQYKPNYEIVQKIENVKDELDIIVFLGTWCADSRRNVPRFFNVIKNKENFRIKIWAVDHFKKLDNDMIDKYTIKRVPTFIFIKNDVEIGRITENPVTTMEEDIFEILTSI